MAKTYRINDGENLTGITLDGDMMYVNDGGLAVATTVLNSGIQYVKSGGMAEQTTLEANGSLYVYAGGTIDRVTLAAQSIMYIYAGALAENLILANGGMLYAETGATLSGTHENGTFSIAAGVASNFILYKNGKLVVASDDSAIGTTIKSKGILQVAAGGSATGIMLENGGILNVTISAEDRTSLSGMTPVGSFSLASGVAENFLVYRDAEITVSSDGMMQNTWIAAGGLVDVAGGGIISETTSDRGSFLSLAAGAIVRNTKAGGSVSVAGTVNAEDTAFVFELTSRKITDSYIVDFLSNIDNAEFSVAVSRTQTAGCYKLASGADTFAESVALTVDGDVAGTLSVGTPLHYYGRDYALTVADAVLSLSVAVSPAPELVAAASGANWSGVSGAIAYSLAITQGQAGCASMLLHTAGTAYDFFNVPDGEYVLQVGETGAETSSEPKTLDITGNIEPVQAVSVANGTDDLFWAKTNEVWTSNYIARNTATNDRVAIAGMNRFRDVFTGSTDANILCLTDTVNGDAFFLDDIYSEYGNASRLAGIDEIRAGAGNDVIDLTSSRYSSSNPGVVVRSGDGDDTIWGNNDGGSFFGDAGNDIVVGGAGDDLFAGGAGDDILTGCGGSDLFLFGGGWGNDTVRQTGDGGVILWFAEGEKIQAEQRGANAIFTGTGGTVTVENYELADLTLYIGSTGRETLYAQYDELGAFDEFSTQRIFELAQLV